MERKRRNRSVYRSAADALENLLSGRVEQSPCTITKTAGRIIYLTNGIKYYEVEVTSEKGVQYGISAYDEEAEELCKVAMKRRAAMLETPMAISTA